MDEFDFANSYDETSFLLETNDDGHSFVRPTVWALIDIESHTVVRSGSFANPDDVFDFIASNLQVVGSERPLISGKTTDPKWPVPKSAATWLDRDFRVGWRADPRWLRELAWLKEIYEAHGSYLPHHAEEDAARRLGLKPTTVRARFSVELRLEEGPFLGFRLGADEAEAASVLPDLVAAYKQSRWNPRIPMRIFIGALAYYRKNRDLGPAVQGLFTRSAKRPNTCKACREWSGRHRKPQTP